LAQEQIKIDQGTIMANNIDGITSAVSTGTYSISGALIVGDWLSMLDQHAAAFGVILGALTFLTNFVFQLMNHRVIRNRIHNEDDGA
jgi:hypothetical protein